MTDSIQIKALTLEELAGVVNLYPWYGPARKELCRRMAGMGYDAVDRTQFAEAALYLPDREILADFLRKASKGDFSDKDLSKLLRAFIEEDSAAPEKQKRSVKVVGGDYFTQAQYDNVKASDDNVFSRFAVKASIEASSDEGDGAEIDDDFCTEPLAQIYAEQGYFEQAKHIYSKLLLKFPEKSAYFAALLENLN